VRRIANLNLPRILSIRFTSNWVANLFRVRWRYQSPPRFRSETTTRRPERTIFLVGRRPDNGLSAMGAWNPHAGLVYRPPTRTPTSMLCASSSVRAPQPSRSFFPLPGQREPDAHTLLIALMLDRLISINDRIPLSPYVFSPRYLCILDGWLSVVSPSISFTFSPSFDVCDIVIR
jgi:hypothetical protein